MTFSNSKLAHRLLLPWGTFTSILVFLYPSVFKLAARMQQTGGKTCNVAALHEATEDKILSTVTF